MITLHSTLDLDSAYPLERLGRLEDLLFFDIETTGFSGEHSTLYLIGCTYYEAGAWKLIQWFADTLDAERDVLCAFFEFLSRFTTVIHFNGDGFDIPYLMKRCRCLNLPYDFTGILSIDIYKKIRPYRKLLGLDSMKQKAIEQFLGIQRTDLYNGGQLIEIYADYLITHEQALFNLLILHNEDDLKGMPSILPILNYPDFIEHDFTLVKQELLNQVDIFGNPAPKLQLECKSNYQIPIPFSQSSSLVVIGASGNTLTVLIDLYEGTLKHFYSNYKDYYYLIYEDTAIHKSVAEYVDRDAKIRANAKNCYTKSKGLYLPQISLLWEPYLQAEYKDKLTYVPYDETIFQDGKRLNEYIRQLMHHL